MPAVATRPRAVVADIPPYQSLPVRSSRRWTCFCIFPQSGSTDPTMELVPYDMDQHRHPTSLTCLASNGKKRNTIGEKHGHEDRGQERGPVPVQPHRRRRQDEPRLVAEPAAAGAAAPAFLEVRPDGRGLRLREGIQEPRLQGAEEGPGQADDRLAGLVAGGLRPLRAAVHPHGLARRRNLPHPRRPRRRRPRPAALRPAQQLARQRQHRQVAPPAVADQAEVRQEDLLGRPADPRRQRRAGVDGLQDLRLRRRPCGRVGAGRGRELGRRDRLAGRRQALQRRPRADRAVRRHPHGPDLRQPGRPERQRRLHGGGQGHPCHLRPHGDERRGDRRPHRRRPHLRQGPWRRPGIAQGSGTGRRAAGSAGPGLDEQLRQGARRRHDFERHRSDLDQDPGAVEQQLLREPVQVRMGADQVAGRRQAMGGQERAGDHSRRARPVEEAQADHADHRPDAALRSGIRQDLAQVPRRPAGLRRCLRARLVQADAPRHGPARPLPRARKCRRKS